MYTRKLELNLNWTHVSSLDINLDSRHARTQTKNRIRCHLLPYFNSDPNTDMDLIEYEYKMNVSVSNFYSDIYSIPLKVHIVKFNIDE